MAGRGVAPDGEARRGGGYRAMMWAGQTAKWVFTNAVAARSGTIIIGLILAHSMSPSGFGAFGVSVVALLVTQSVAGMTLARVIYRRKTDADALAPTAMTISILLGLAIAGGAFLGAPAFAAAVRTPAAARVIRVLVASVVFSGVAAVPRGMLWRQSPGRQVLVDQLDNWAGIASAAGFALTGNGLMSLALGRVIGSVLAAELFIVLTPWRMRIGFSRRAAASLLRAALPVTASSTTLIVVGNVDLLIIARQLHATDLGFYVLAGYCANWPILMFSQPVRDMAPAAFARFRKGRWIFHSAFSSAVTLLVCVTLPTCLLLASLAGPIVRMAYGPHWAPAARLVPWLALLMALRVFHKLADEYFTLLASSSRRTLMFQLAWLVATVPVVILGTRRGIEGVAVAQVALAAVLLLTRYVPALRSAATWSRIRVIRLLALLGAVAVVGLITFVVRRMFPDDDVDVTIGVVATLATTGLLVSQMRGPLAAVRYAAEGVEAGPRLMPSQVAPMPGPVIERPLHTVLGTGPLTVVPLEPVPEGGGELGSKIRAGARWSMLNTIVVRVGTFGVGVVLARTVFGPKVWGLYAVSQVVLTLLLSANELGVSAAVIRWETNVRPVARTVLTMSIVSSLFIYGALYLAGPGIARVLGSPQATTVIRVICLCVIIDGFAGVPIALLDRTFAQGRRMLVDLANFAVSTGVTLWLAYAGKGALSFAWGSVAGCLVALAVAMAAAPQFIVPGWDRALAGTLLRFGLPLAAASLLTLGVVNIDSAIVGATLGPVMLGLYQLAFNISSWPVASISQAVNRVSFAGFSRVAESAHGLADAFNRGLAILMALTVPACVLLATLAEPLIHTVYGARWTPASHVLTLLAVLGLMRVAYGLMYSCMAAAGQRQTLMWVQAIWLGALIPVLLAGAKLDGITGVGIGHDVVAGALVGPLFLWCFSRIGITARSMARACLRPVLGGLLMTATSLFVIHATGRGLTGLVAATAAALAVYGFVVFPMRTLLRSSPPRPLAEPAEAEEASLAADG